jgi:hypothetical protein
MMKTLWFLTLRKTKYSGKYLGLVGIKLERCISRNEELNKLYGFRKFVNVMKLKGNFTRNVHLKDKEGDEC